MTCMAAHTGGHRTPIPTYHLRLSSQRKSCIVYRESSPTNISTEQCDLKTCDGGAGINSPTQDFSRQLVLPTSSSGTTVNEMITSWMKGVNEAESESTSSNPSHQCVPPSS